MTTSERKHSKAETLTTRARDVSFDDDKLVVDLVDGRRISVPIEWFPRLAAALAEQPNELKNWRLIGSGIGINWPGLDEHVSVENLLADRADLLSYREVRYLRPSGRPRRRSES
jgi:hypothetical protein